MARQPFHPYRSEEAKAEFEAHCAEWAKAWPIPSETLNLTTPSGHTLVRANGRTTDPALVLLPGARSGSLMWTDGIGALSARHRTYALDIIGDVGLSVNHRKVSSYEDLTRWLDEVLDQLVPEGPVSVIGISYGGAIAAQHALRRPQRLRKVVLLAPGATVLRFSWAFYARIMLLMIPRPGVQGTPLQRMLHWLFRDAVHGDEACRARLEQVIAHLRLGMRTFALPPPPWPKVLTDEEWRSFRVPCLFVVGENEKIYSADAAIRRLNRVAPQVRTELIPGAGHDMGLVHPEFLNRKILDFLDA